MKNIMDTHGFNQLITEPTRGTLSFKTLIDHIYVNNDHKFSSAGVIPLGISDHHLIYAIQKKAKSGSNQHINIRYRDVKNLDEKQMSKDMRAVNWNSIREMSNVSDMWS